VGDANRINAGNAIANRYRWGAPSGGSCGCCTQDSMSSDLIMGISREGRGGDEWQVFQARKLTYWEKSD
jgi:hypothetical protein